MYVRRYIVRRTLYVYVTCKLINGRIDNGYCVYIYLHEYSNVL